MYGAAMSGVGKRGSVSGGGGRGPKPPAARAKSPEELAAEAKVLAVLANPKLLGKSTSEKIRKSGLSRSTWYRSRSDPVFLSRMTDACREALDEYTGSVLQALADSASAPGRSGHADRKLFLQLVGHYVPGAKGPVEAEPEPEEQPAMTIEEVVEWYKGAEDRLPPGIKRLIGLDPKVPPELLPELQARAGLDPAKVAKNVTEYRARQAST